MILDARRTGDPALPPLVLLHAIATSGAMWRPQMTALADRFHVVTIDLPGHGASALPPPDADVGNFAHHVIETLDALGLERVSLVGLSLGSMVAQCVAAGAPKRVGALVLSNGIAFAPETVRAVWTQRLAEAEAAGMAATVEGMLARWFTPDFLATDPPAAAEMGVLIAATRIAGFAAAARAIMTLDNRAGLSRITAPTLVLAGEQDTASPPQAVRLVAEAISGARFATLPAGHLMNLELPDAYSALLADFLVEVGAATRNAA